ncbi:hypothetical protein VNO80_16110 [Phaseolus coccineus]|uniref:Uncharacterized protein n=1 Tax=Phaseolus coccineus TaxID=3886 RepID=A0AAN9MMW8_PHACN
MSWERIEVEHIGVLFSIASGVHYPPQSNGLRVAICLHDIDHYQPHTSKTTAKLKERNKSNKDKPHFDQKMSRSSDSRSTML